VLSLENIFREIPWHNEKFLFKITYPILFCSIEFMWNYSHKHFRYYSKTDILFSLSFLFNTIRNKRYIITMSISKNIHLSLSFNKQMLLQYTGKLTRPCQIHVYIWFFLCASVEYWRMKFWIISMYKNDQMILIWLCN